MSRPVGEQTTSEYLRSIIGMSPEVRIGIIVGKDRFNEPTPFIDVSVMPKGELVSLRYIQPGTSKERGLYWEPVEGDEVVVLCIDGELHDGVAIAGLVSRSAPRPGGLGDGITAMHPNGMKVVKTPTSSTQPPVLAPLPADLKDALDDISGALQQRIIVPVPTTIIPQDGGAGVYAGTIIPLLVELKVAIDRLRALLSQPNAYLSQSMDIE